MGVANLKWCLFVSGCAKRIVCLGFYQGKKACFARKGSLEARLQLCSLGLSKQEKGKGAAPVATGDDAA